MVGADQADQRAAFFADPAAFELLKARVFPQILEDKWPGGQLRVWVPRCGTGEEVYSYAIALLEHLDDRAQDFRVQIFGTDLDGGAIAQARRGSYPLDIAQSVSAERLQRFFVKRGDHYQVSPRVRDAVFFALQDVAHDAPFSRLDVASCRRLKDERAVRERVLRVLHSALNPIGFVVLGSVEPALELFSCVDGATGIWLKRPAPGAAPVIPDMPRVELLRPGSAPTYAAPAGNEPAEQRLDETERALKLALDELDATREALRASQEQLRTTTEQLQLSHDALEVSKQELVSTYGEAHALHEELYSQRAEFQRTQDDLNSLLASSEDIVVVMGSDFRIRRFSSGAQRRVDLGPGDIGARVSRLNAFVPSERVQELAAGVLAHLTALELQVRAADGRHYTLRVTPTVDPSNKGVIFVMSEVVSRR
jgi:chemotaxis methyl-accepting protein methylase